MQINKQNAVSFIVAAIALINACCHILGLYTLPIGEETVSQLVTVVASVATTAYAWWKNNSTTTHAIKADEVKEAIKDGLITLDQVTSLLETAKDGTNK